VDAIRITVELIAVYILVLAAWLVFVVLRWVGLAVPFGGFFIQLSTLIVCKVLVRNLGRVARDGSDRGG